MKTKKVVINKCFGGFGLSKEAVFRYAELKGLKIWHYIDCGMDWYSLVPLIERNKKLNDWTSTPEEIQQWNEIDQTQSLYEKDIPRDDPILIHVVEELKEKANGRFASLRIVEIPDDIEYTIEEYDGNERVEEIHRSWG